MKRVLVLMIALLVVSCSSESEESSFEEGKWRWLYTIDVGITTAQLTPDSEGFDLFLKLDNGQATSYRNNESLVKTSYEIIPVDEFNLAKHDIIFTDNPFPDLIDFGSIYAIAETEEGIGLGSRHSSGHGHYFEED